MVHNRRMDSQATLWSVRSAERNWKGVPLSVGAMLQRKDRSPPDLFLSHYSIAPYASQEKTEGRNVCGRITATYKVVADAGGGRVFRFYCDISGELCCVTKPIQADTEEAALELAWDKEGKWEFNRCPKCGKYVSSAMFNVNAGLCLDCAPWEDEYPSFCHHCGARLRESDTCFCPTCGAKLIADGMDRKEGTP